MDYSNFKFPKPKNVKKRRITVSDKTYKEVAERDNYRCRLCGKTNIELHHIVYRSEDKSKINDVNNCIMLCTEHHQMVHSNKKKWKPILMEMIR